MSFSKAVFYPRYAAIRVLTRVLSDFIPLDEALGQIVSEVPSSSLAWLQEVCSGTIRWKGRLDGILDSVAFRKKPSGWLRKVLLVAAYQLVVQDRSPAAAVVSETVEMIREKEGEAPARFANACLRRVAEFSSQWKNQGFPEGQVLKAESAWASLPEWLWSRLKQQHGQGWAMAYALAGLERPTLWLRARSMSWKASWVESGPLPLSWKVIEGGAVTLKPGFLEGDWIVQDISSQKLIAEILEMIRLDRGDLPLRVLDLCAAPGGKAVGLSWFGVKVQATEKLEKRVPLLKETVARVAPEIEVLSWSQAQISANQDWIWVDAPCSGTGILRRHPDVRWLRQEKELSSLHQVQEELIGMAWKNLAQGGYMTYSVCSVLKEEGPEAISQAKKSGLLPGMTQSKEWFLCPQNAPYGDGFWAVLLKKEK